MQEKDKWQILSLISGDLWAGAEAMACHLLRGLRDYEDLALTAIVLNPGRLLEELRGMGIAAVLIDENQHSFWQIVLKSRRIIGCSRPDIIHSHRYKENLLALLLRGKGPHTKLIASQHGLPESPAGRPGMLGSLRNAANFLILSRFFTTVSVSEEIGTVLTSSLGFRKSSVETIHNGIALPAVLRSPAADRQRFVIGSAGRLFPVKDYPLMVEVARCIAATGDEEVRFELAGDGPERAQLQSLVSAYGLSGRFTFRGQQEDMASFYRGLDIYLCTSLHEGIPLTILEALAHGVPVVAPAVGGIVEIVEDGREGFLLQERQAESFARKCLVLRNDREKRDRMARAARERAERAFSRERMAERYHDLYRRIASQR